MKKNKKLRWQVAVVLYRNMYEKSYNEDVEVDMIKMDDLYWGRSLKEARKQYDRHYVLAKKK